MNKPSALLVCCVLVLVVALSVASLALASPAYQGTFPQTGILDDFNRADQGPPPSSNWTTVFGSGFVVDTLQAAPTTTDAPLTFFNTPMPADSEAWVIIPTRQSDLYSIYVLARLDSEADFGYGVAIDRDDVGGDILSLNSFTTGPLFTATISYEDGDGIGIRCIGSTIYAFYYKSSEGWVLEGSSVNTDTITGGFVGLYTTDSTTTVLRLDNFGGGDITEPTQTPTLTPTSTPTRTPTPTWTPTMTFTPGPTRTPVATPTYRATFESRVEIEPDPGGTDTSIFGNVLTWGVKVKNQIDNMNLMFTTTIDDTALRIHAYSPLPLLRGAAIVFADFDWLVKIVGWFIFAAIVIILVSAVRFIISMWGIIQRLLEIIKAIPFI